MELNYTLESKHFQDFATAASRELAHANGLIGQLTLGIIFGSIVAAAGLAILMLSGGNSGIAGAFGVGAWFFWLINYVTAIYIARRSASLGFLEDGLILGPRALLVDDDGIHMKSDVFTQDLRWKAIKSISVQHLVVVLWTEKAAGIFVPRSAFGHREQERLFVSFVRSKIDVAPAH